MKKQIRLKSAAICAALLSPFLFKVSSLGGLPDIAKPYLGTYECQSIVLGEEDRTKNFDYVLIELLDKGKMRLLYREADGKEGKIEGKYSYDAEKSEATFYAEFAGKEYKKTVPVENGKMNVTVRYGGKVLQMKFERK